VTSLIVEPCILRINKISETLFEISSSNDRPVDQMNNENKYSDDVFEASECDTGKK